MGCFREQKSDYVKGKKKLKSKHNEHVWLPSPWWRTWWPRLYCTVLYCTVLLTVLTFSLMADLMTSRSSSCLRYFCLRSLSACLMASCLNNKTSQSSSGIVISLLSKNNSGNCSYGIRYIRFINYTWYMIHDTWYKSPIYPLLNLKISVPWFPKKLFSHQLPKWDEE